MDVGTEWLIDAIGCEGDKLSDPAVLRTLCGKIIEELGLLVVGEGQWHQFPSPGGVTALFLLTESHLSMHTFPEHGVAAFNLYCCRPRKQWPWAENLAESLGAKQVVIRKMLRGPVVSVDDATCDCLPAEREDVG